METTSPLPPSCVSCTHCKVDEVAFGWKTCSHPETLRVVMDYVHGIQIQSEPNCQDSRLMGKKCGLGGRLWEQKVEVVAKCSLSKQKMGFWRWLLNYKQSLSIR